MAKIKTLYSAIMKYQKEEDICTNFLVWLIDKLPSEVLTKICEESNLSIMNEIQNNLYIDVQHQLENSIPDALIRFSHDKYIIIETKLNPNAFDRKQFLNHFNGGGKKFGYDNIWLLFLSGDKNIPSELNDLILNHKGKIGHISWSSILKLLEGYRESLGEKYELIISEFLIFAKLKHYKLGRLISMNNEEMKRYIENYNEIGKFWRPCKDKLLETIDTIKDKIIIDGQEKIKEYTEDKADKLPLLYKCLNIKDWHTDRSAYIYIDISKKLVGVCLTGYQDDEDDRKEFSKVWTNNLKDKCQKDLKLISFTWVKEGSDGYFKEVKDTTGKSFNPTDTTIFSSYFYFGYIYELDVQELEALTERIAEDFIALLKGFNLIGVAH